MTNDVFQKEYGGGTHDWNKSQQIWEKNMKEVFQKWNNMGTVLKRIIPQKAVI